MTLSTYQQAEAAVIIENALAEICRNPAINHSGISARALTVAALPAVKSTHYSENEWAATPSTHASPRSHVVCRYLQAQAAAASQTQQPDTAPEAANLAAPHYPINRQKQLTSREQTVKSLPEQEPALTVDPKHPVIRNAGMDIGPDRPLHLKYDRSLGTVKLTPGNLILAEACLIATPGDIPGHELQPAVAVRFADAWLLPHKIICFHQTVAVANTPQSRPSASLGEKLRYAALEAAFRSRLHSIKVEHADAAWQHAADAVETLDNPHHSIPLGNTPAALCPLGPVRYLDHRTGQFRNGYRYGVVKRFTAKHHAYRTDLCQTNAFPDYLDLSESLQKKKRNARLSRLPAAATERIREIEKDSGIKTLREKELHYQIRQDRCTGEVTVTFGNRIPQHVQEAVSANLPEHTGVTLLHQADPERYAALPWDPPSTLKYVPTGRTQYPTNTAGREPAVVGRFTAENQPAESFMHHQLPPEKPGPDNSDRLRQTEAELLATLRAAGFSITEKGLSRLCQALLKKN